MGQVTVRIPTPLKPIVDNQAEVSASGNTIEEVFGGLIEKYPDLTKRLYDENKQLRRFINVYVNDEDIRFLDGASTEVKEGDEISIVPAIAGGL